MSTTVSSNPPQHIEAAADGDPMPQDFLPRMFQADLDRFYVKVIRATLSELALHEDVKTGELTSMDEFLDNAEKHTSNLVAYEARRSFALALAAIFERQLQLWLLKRSAEEKRLKSPRCGLTRY